MDGMTATEKVAQDRTETVRTLVRSLIDDFVPRGTVSDVSVDVGEDSDGNRVFRIMIVLELGDRSIDGKRLGGFTRHLRSQMDDDAFPIVSYVSRSDADKLKRASQ